MLLKGQRPLAMRRLASASIARSAAAALPPPAAYSASAAGVPSRGAARSRRPTARATPAAADGDAALPDDAWSRFLSSLHARGYFAAAAEASEETEAAAASGLIRRFGDAGAHKRAVLAFARERDGQLPALPAASLRALAAAPLPQAALDGTFGGRKAVNAALRLRAALGIAPAEVGAGCEVVRSSHTAQGEATLQDAARLLLSYATARLPPLLRPPPAACAELLDALMALPKDGPATASTGTPMRVTVPPASKPAAAKPPRVLFSRTQAAAAGGATPAAETRQRLARPGATPDALRQLPESLPPLARPRAAAPPPRPPVPDIWAGLER